MIGDDMAHYEIIKQTSKGNNDRLVIKGLRRKEFDIEGNKIKEKILSDTDLVLFDIYPTWKSNKEHCDSLHDILYDEYQVNDFIKEGDTFHLAKVTMKTWDKHQITLSEMFFKAQDVHIIKID